MNIGLFTETYYPEINGVAASVYVLKEELEKKGHNVYVFTTTSPGSPKVEKNVYRVHSLPCVLIRDRRVGLMYQRRIASKIKKLNLDIIHTNTEFSLGVFGHVMAKELKVPIIHTYHTIYEDYTHYVTKGIILDNRMKKLVRVFSKLCCNSVQEVIVPTQKVKELLQEYHVCKEIRVIPTGIDLTKFYTTESANDETRELKSSYGINESDKVILYLGRVSQEKNLQEIFEYIPDYLKEHRDCKFVLVGDGPYRKHIEKKAGNLDVKDSIVFLGEKPYSEIQKYYRLGNVFVSASQSETQGLTFIEAMAAGLPVVAKEDECLDGILKEEENGYFFRNKTEFSEALDKILYNGREKEFAENALQTAREHSTEEFAENILSVYEEVLKQRYEVVLDGK